MFDDHWRICCQSQDLLEKGPSRHNILKDQKIPKKYEEIMFRQETEAATRRKRGEPQGGLTHRGHGPTYGRTGLW
jgi:hypothetical protein